MPYTISFYPTEEISSKVTSKVYEKLEELLEKELGDGEVDDVIKESICYGSWSCGISYDREGNIIELDTDDGDRFADYNGSKVCALDGKLVFDFGYPPAFCVEDLDYVD
jgi:hypothetical protein